VTLDRLVLHIGAHKTGTTAVQGAFVDAFDALLARRVLYPRAGRRGPGHAQLAGEVQFTEAPVTSAPSHQGVLEEVREAEPGTLVLSSEHFTPAFGGFLVDWAVALRDELRPREVLVVGYVRPQWEYIESSYAQEVKVGLTSVPFAEYLDRSLETGAHFDYVRKFERWRNAFGEDLAIRPYAKRLMHGRDVVADFWRHVGLGRPPEAQPRYANRRPGARATEMLRALSARIGERAPRREILRRAQRRIERSLPDDPPFAPLTPELVERVVERFSDSNARFVHDFMGGAHAELFEPPDAAGKSAAPWSLDDASPRERRLFEALVAESLRSVPGARRGPAPASERPVATYAEPAPARACVICGASLERRPPDARFCSAACRREHRRAVRLLGG
jgi:hypothetical protein